MGYRIDSTLCQQIAFNDSTSTKSGNPVNADNLVLYATKDCFVRLSANPTATATGAGNIFVPAQTFFELDTNLQRGWYLAAIGSAESGTLYINAAMD